MKPSPSNGPVFNPAAIEPLFMLWEFPNAHRQRAESPNAPPKIVKRRRPSPILVANNLRAAIRDFRDSHYACVSDTSGELLFHWFETDHAVTGKGGASEPFPTTSASGKPGTHRRGGFTGFRPPSCPPKLRRRR